MTYHLFLERQDYAWLSHCPQTCPGSLAHRLWHQQPHARGCHREMAIGCECYSEDCHALRVLTCYCPHLLAYTSVQDIIQTQSHYILYRSKVWGLVTCNKTVVIFIYDYLIKGRVSNLWKPMLIFKKKKITKTNTSLPQKGLAPILIDPPHIYVAYTTQATISSVKHKALFYQNCLEQHVQGNFFPPDLLLSAFPSRSKLPRRLGKQSGELMLGLRVFLNTMYANFRLASSVVRTSRVRLRSVSSYGRNDASLVILQTAASLNDEWMMHLYSAFCVLLYTQSALQSCGGSLLDNISQLVSATAIFLTLFTDKIYQTPLPLFVFI